MNLFIRIDSITNLPNAQGCESVNPYVIANLISHNVVRQTRVVNNTVNPIFSDVLTFPLPFIDGNISIVIAVKSRNIFGEDRKIGYCNFREVFHPFELIERKIRLTTCGTTSNDSFIKISLQIARMNNNVFGVHTSTNEIRELKEVTAQPIVPIGQVNTLHANDFFNPFAILLPPPAPPNRRQQIYVEEEDDNDDIVVIGSSRH